MANEVKKGIVLYNIELDGCLNGVFINEHSNGRIWNELLKKLDDTKADNSIEGTYTAIWIDEEQTNGVDTAIVEVVYRDNAFDFTWKHIIGGTRWKGIGYKMNHNQIVVNYWSHIE